MQHVAFQPAQRSHLAAYSEGPCPRNTGPEQTGEGGRSEGGSVQSHKA